MSVATHHSDAELIKRSITCSAIMSIVFILIFIGVAIFMGFSFIEFAEEWPDWAPGPSPASFTWIPFAMAGFGILILAIIIINSVKKIRMGDTYHSTTSRRDAYYSDSSATFETSGFTEPTYIRVVPKYCNNCGSQIDERTVEWIGSMTFVCPFCGEKQRAERKAI